MPPNSTPHGGSIQQDQMAGKAIGGERRQKRWVKRYRTEVAASVSSVLSTFSAFPLDSVKTRMQTYKYNSFADCVRHTYQTEKLRGFFRGVTAPMASVTLVRTISFSVYQRSKYTYAAWFKRHFGLDPLVHVNTPGTYPTFSTVACFGAAGATAGSFITLVACPFELTKVSAQVSVLMADHNKASTSDPLNSRGVAASYQNKGTFQTAKNIVKHRGIAGLYSGFNLHLLRDTLGTAIYFMTYESSKQLLTTYTGDRSPTNPLAVLFAGGLCGVASWALIYPIDSAKSIYQRNCLTVCKGQEVKKAPKIQFLNKLVAMARTKNKVGKPIKAKRPPGRMTKEERRAQKLEQRKKEKAKITADMWAAPAPSHLVAKLDMPRVKSKYQSYFEFAENTEKKEKKLEFQVTNDSKPPPGFAFVPIGDPDLTKACKELSRERDAMIFIVSGSKEEKSKISEHMYRTGYHFREMIVDEARDIVGETVLTRPTITPGQIEPIPDSQEEINKQADAAIRDLFPRIPHTDRTMIIEHAFKKGAQFHGEPTVGLQADLPLSRRVQLAVLAHIRHTHTRYDKLLRETTWMNARKVVEPVCLDVLVKWRGDEETGRDQMDEILREVVIITDSEEEDDSSSEDDSSEEEGEVTSPSTTETPSQPSSRNQPRPVQLENRSGPQSNAVQQSNGNTAEIGAVSSRTRAKRKGKIPKEKQVQRGFKRYQAAWDDALNRRQGSTAPPNSHHVNTPFEGLASRRPVPAINSPLPSMGQHPGATQTSMYRNPEINNGGQVRYDNEPGMRPDPYYSQYRVPTGVLHRNEVIVRPPFEQHINQDVPTRLGTPSQHTREQRPPQVVRASPQRHGLQDMLVPSIETASSDVIGPSVRLDEWRNINDSFNYRQESYPRPVVESRRPSPPRRQVIVLDDDDGPQLKRRRVVVEDDSGRFRPLPSRDYNVHAPVEAVDSHLLPPSSVQPRDFLNRRPAVLSESSQGMFRDTRSSHFASTERIPIYDAPEPGYLARPPERFRRADLDASQLDASTIIRIASPAPHDQRSEPVFYRPLHEGVNGSQSMRNSENDRGFRQMEPDYRGAHAQRPPSPSFPVPSRVSRSYDLGPGRAVIDQAFIHNFSQSRLDGPIPQSRDGYSVVQERSQNFGGPSNLSHGYQDHSARSYATPPARARSPAAYVERPIHHGEGVRRPTAHEDRHTDEQGRYEPENRPPIFVRERVMAPSGGPPTYVRPMPTRRQVVVHD
ncbi:hypothetical protein G7Y89_g3124 [Cudoniella acicularis]|uniref:DUF2293 domain-containing protein n=1 Tax=Cudoniella acicularis TaxID=354080 RepID=A0A8H4RU24_9HELO|nr:hypothetical protein G7Y89_g3124 [Cudoniella acicularis]